MRLALFAALFLPALPAQNFQRPIQPKRLLPPINQPWTKGNFKRPVVVKPLVPPLNKPWTKTQPRILIAEEHAGPCSIPLLSAGRVEKGTAIVIAPPPQTIYTMRMATMPAPPCEPAQR
jgi:hypothetical protein